MSDDKITDELPINIVIIVDGDYLNRFGDIFAKTLLGLIGVPINITLIGCDTQNDISPLLNAVRVLHFNTPILPWRYNKQIENLCNELGNSKINLIHSFSGRAGRLAGDIAKRLNIPYIVSFTGLLQEECHLHVDTHLCKALIGISQPIVDTLTEFYGKFRDKIHLIRPGCFYYPRENQSKLSHSLVTLGRFDRHSGFDILLQALSRLNKNGKEIFTVILGSGPLESYYRKWVANNELRESVLIIDQLANWHKLLAEADFYIQPGPFYSLHCGPYQALAHSCPIIATDDTAMDLVIDNQTGKLFSAGNVDALVQILSDWLDEKIDWPAMSQAAGDFAKNELSLTQNIEKTVTLYKSVLASFDT